MQGKPQELDANVAAFEAHVHVLSQAGMQLHSDANVDSTDGTHPLVVAMNLGDFSRQKTRLHLKGYVNPAVYPLLLERHDGAAPPVTGLPNEPLWLYEFRWWLGMLPAHAHPTTSRCGI